MKFISWNVNGIRAAAKKGALDFFAEEDPDFICLQETKATRAIVEEMGWGVGYRVFANEAEKKGYSGTAIVTKHEPLSVEFGLGIEEHDNEGRVVTVEMEDFYLVTVYTPNAQNELRRLSYRQGWDVDFLIRMKQLEAKKPVIFCGDLNVAHTEEDLANPKTNRKNAGFSDEERAGFDQIVSSGFVDTFREFHQGNGHYSWWSYRGGCRDRNVGWRIDYFCISEVLRPKLKTSVIRPEILGSDHCPVQIEMDL